MDKVKQEHVKRIHDTFMMLMQVSKRWFVQHLQHYNLTLPQFVTLASLTAYQQPCTMSDLTQVTFQDPPTMTGVIDRLVKMDMVQRTRSQTDRRVVLVKTTAAGTKLIEAIKADTMQEMFASYDDLEVTELINLEETLRLLLRIHLKQSRPVQDPEVDREIETLAKFVEDPISYIKLESAKA